MTNKNPYVAFTLKQVNSIEKNYFTLQFGGDFAHEDGSYLFTKKEVEKIYEKTINDLVGIIRNGNQKDKIYALDLILTTFILPARIH